MSKNQGTEQDNSGHRDRVRERVRQEGMAHFQSYEILEFMLMYAIPRKDVKPIAKELIRRFGSLSAVLEAYPEELATVPGIGLSTATLLASYRMVMQRYHQDRWQDTILLATPQKAGEYCAAQLYGQPNEKLILVCLDNACHLRGTFEMGEGSIDAAPLFLRKIIRKVFTCGARQVLLAHNHPSGLMEPSRTDYEATLAVQQALEKIDVRLIDHFIVAGKKHCRVLQPEYRTKLRLCEAESFWWDSFPNVGDTDFYPTWEENGNDDDA